MPCSLLLLLVLSLIICSSILYPFWRFVFVDLPGNAFVIVYMLASIYLYFPPLPALPSFKFAGPLTGSSFLFSFFRGICYFPLTIMSYSSTAVRFFTSPKPLGGAMESPKQPTLEPKITSSTNQGLTNGEVPAQSKPNGAVVAPDASSTEKKGLTFSNQDSLPKLPIPDLEDTCKRYIESLSALQTPREQDETKAAVQDFLKTDGPVLQDKLKNYASSKTSYIEQFCMLASFLRFQKSKARF